MVSSKLGTQIRLMDSVICDVEIALYEEISLSLLRLSKAHPGQIIEYVYEPPNDDTWSVAIGMEPHKDEHLDACLRTATAYAGMAPVPQRHMQVLDSKFIHNRKYVRGDKTRKRRVVHPMVTAGRGKPHVG